MLRLLLLLFLSAVLVNGDGHHGSSGSSLFSKYDNHPRDHKMTYSEFHHFVSDFDSWPYDGIVSEHEFLNGWTASQSGLTEDGSATLFFLRTDFNHDGQIDSTDLEKLYHLFDENGDQVVSSGEFCDAFSAMYYALSHC